MFSDELWDDFTPYSGTSLIITDNGCYELGGVINLQMY